MSHNPLTSKGFRQLTLVTSGWSLFLIFMGAVVQATGVALLLSITVAFIAWRDYHRQHRLILRPALAAAAVLLLQIFLGTVTVWFNQQPLIVMAQLLATTSYLALNLFLTTVVHLPTEYVSKAGISSQRHKSFFRLLLVTGATMLLLLVSGAIVTETNTGPACPDWPLCQGEIFPAQAHLGVIIHLFHRFSVVAAGALIAAIVLQTYRRYAKHHPGLKKWSTILGLLFLIQTGLGGLNVLMQFPPIIKVIHLGLASAIWGSLVILTTIFYLTAQSLLPVEEDNELARNHLLSTGQKATIYFKLTKPWILVLLLITTVTAMFIAAKGLPPISLILYTLLGGALSAGGASVINSYVDSDIDRLMSRTSRRATASGLVTPEESLFFGLALSTLSFLIFVSFVNPLSAALSTLGIIYYVFFYTLYLKRTTIHNIIIGGAAGAIPPLVGWTAVTGTLDLGAFYLFAIIFFWTPPHTWALALLVKKDYAQARVPMLPVVAGEKETTYQIFLYSVLLITLTLLPFTFSMVSLAYLMAAITLGVPFLYLAWKLWRNYRKSYSKRLYKFSQAYLALLFLVMAIDRTLF